MAEIKDEYRKVELNKMKQHAVEYYKNNDVLHRMQNVLNSMFLENPNDVHGHLANYFDKLSLEPTIAKLSAQEVFDSAGQVTVEVTVHCIIRNKVQPVTTFLAPNPQPVYVASSALTSEENRTEQQKNAAAAVSIILQVFDSCFSRKNPFNQALIDKTLLDLLDQLKVEEEMRLAKEKEDVAELSCHDFISKSPVDSPREGHGKVKRKSSSPSRGKTKSPRGKQKGPPVNVIPDEPPEKMLTGSVAVSAVSQCVCKAAAILSNKELYQYIHTMMNQSEEPEGFRLPLPLITMLQAGRTAPGKLKCVKEFLLTPAPLMARREAIHGLFKIQHRLSNMIAVRQSTMQGTNEFGTVLFPVDRSEQGLDMIQEAITSSGYRLQEHYSIIINCAAHETFDFERGRYEMIAGQLKTSDEVVKYWTELLGRYPSVIGLIDPLRKQDRETWMKLCEAVSQRCFIIGDFIFHRPGVLVNETLPVDLQTSGCVLRLDSVTTVTEMLASVKKMTAAGNQVIICNNPGEGMDDFMLDLAIGSGARWVKVGGLTRGERTMKLNRILRVAAALEQSGSLLGETDYNFQLLIYTPEDTTKPDEETTSGGRTDHSKVAESETHDRTTPKTAADETKYD